MWRKENPQQDPSEKAHGGGPVSSLGRGVASEQAHGETPGCGASEQTPRGRQ